MPENKSYAEMLRDRLDCGPSDLKKKVTVAEAEKANMIVIRETGRKVPFGYIHGQWRKLLEQMQDGDELWEFMSDDESWEMLAGRAGIALLRDGKIIAEIVTRMN